MVPSERSSSDLSEYNLFQILKKCICKNLFLGDKLRFLETHNSEFVDFLTWPSWALSSQFPGQLISRIGDVKWPDLSPLDFFLWGYLKERVYRGNPTTLTDLKDAVIGCHRFRNKINWSCHYKRRHEQHAKSSRILYPVWCRPHKEHRFQEVVRKKSCLSIF